MKIRIRQKIKRLKYVNSRTYKLILDNMLYPPYWDDGLPKICGYEYRQYRSWKHNRKKQYKK